MQCPFCNASDTRVIDSRLIGEGYQIRRRRECTQCKERFTTYESVELTLPRVIKSDGSREPFDEDKLRAGILKALEKRPVSTDKIEDAIAQIERALLRRSEREVPSHMIGQLAMEQLRYLDKVAYVRFASVYRSFEDVSAFLDEIERLEQELPSETVKRQMELFAKEGEKR